MSRGRSIDNVTARLLTAADQDAWREVLPASRSAFGSLEFARVQRRAGGVEPRLLVAEVDDSRVAYPLQLRSLATLPFADQATVTGWDSTSPPFTGPMAESELSPARAGELAAEIAAALAAEGVVAEFAHLHPWSARPDLLGASEPDREIVWVDVTLEPERLWRQSYTKACRKNVSRADREGVEVRPAENAADIAEFHRVYTATMKRNAALDSYLFGEDLFQAIFEEMPRSARFALAERGGEVIAATLYLHDSDDVYSYLGGADHAHQQLRPTNAVVHDTIRWARAQSKRRLILGGGYRPGDGIFRFKSSFSPQRAVLRLARTIHLPAHYEALAAAWRTHHGPAAGADPGYFPLYRARP